MAKAVSEPVKEVTLKKPEPKPEPAVPQAASSDSVAGLEQVLSDFKLLIDDGGIRSQRQAVYDKLEVALAGFKGKKA